MGYIVSGVISLTVALLSFTVQQLYSDNKRLREGRKQQNIVKEKAIEDALQCLLRVKLIEYHDRYTYQKRIPSYALQNWDLMYQSYHNLGGNGMITGMDIEIRKLPIE